MKLPELARVAIKTGNVESVKTLVIELERLGFTYWGIFEAVNTWTGVGLAEWDALLEDL